MTNRKTTLLATSSLAVMTGAAVTPALPAIADAFSHEPGKAILVPLILTTPALMIALLAPFAGVFADRIGRKSLLLGSLFLYALAGTSGLWVDSLAALIFGRVLMGIAVAGVMTGSTTLIGDYFTGIERRSFLGAQAAFMGFGGVLFVVLGGILADLHWRAPFAIYLAALPLVWISFRVLVEPSRQPLPRPCQLSDRGAVVHWPLIVTIYGLGTLGMALFYLLPVQFPFYLRQLTGASGTQVGLALSASTITGSTISLLYSRIREYLGFRGISSALFCLVGCGFLLLSGASNLPGVVPALVVCGLGFGLVMPNLNVWLTEAAPEHLRGRLIGGLTASLFLGQFLSPLAAYPVASQRGYSGLTGIYGIGGATALAIGLLVMLLMKTQREIPS
jgi:MFS family permease